MRSCAICNNTSKLKNILNLNLTTISHNYLNNQLIVYNCTDCNHFFSDSGNNQNDYNNYYIHYNKYSNELVIPTDKDIRCYNYLFNNLKNINNIIDYGCGNNILASLLKKTYNLVDIYDIGDKFPTNKYDLLILSHVLEHIYDIEQFINNINDLITPEGYLYIEVPNAEYYYEFKELCPLQEINLEHINFFSKYSLAKLMIKYNYIPMQIIDDFFIINDSKYYVIRGIFQKNKKNESIINYISDGIQKIDTINITGLKNVYLFGCGQLLYKIFNKINNNEILNIIDDNSTLQNSYINNIKIINFDMFSKKVKDNDNIIITTLLSHNIINDKLLKLNKQINIITIKFNNI